MISWVSCPPLAALLTVYLRRDSTPSAVGLGETSTKMRPCRASASNANADHQFASSLQVLTKNRGPF